MTMNRPRLMSSNPSKLREFARLGIEADIQAPSADLEEPEVSDPLFVAAHKAFQCGPGALCEDTRLDVQGADIGPLIRFQMDRLEALQGRPATFAVTLALHQGDRVDVWEGAIEGRLQAQDGVGGFGFDPFFVPDGAEGLSLARLEAQGRKDEFSARAKACQALRGHPPLKSFSIESLAAFNGPWQNETLPEKAPGASRPSKP